MRKKICFVVSAPNTAGSFLTEHLMELSKTHEVSLVANFCGDSKKDFYIPKVNLIDVPIDRKISIVKDLKALFKLYSVFRSKKFDAVHSVTPKAGLISMIAARFAGVQARHHTFTGQVWATKSGLFRVLLKTLDRITFSLSSFSLVDSTSQREFLISEGVITRGKSGVLADGSIAGVNISRFKPDIAARERVRREHQVSNDAFIFLYLGRLNYDKGIIELVEAFSLLDKGRVDCYLMLVGPDEENIDSIISAKDSEFRSKLVRVGYTKTPEAYMSAADVFCLPSHREGFGTVILESAACGIPAIGSDIYGVSDAIDNGATGLLHTKKSPIDLSRKMQELLDNRELTKRLGNNALDRARAKFPSSRVIEAMVNFYKEKLNK